MIQKILSDPKRRRKQLIKNKKIYLTEMHTLGSGVFFLFENEDPTCCFQAELNFEVTGYALENHDDNQPNIWSLFLTPGLKCLRKLLHADKSPQKAKRAGFAGAFGGMGGGLESIINDYEQAERTFKFKIKIEEVQLPK